jgi:non-homologous end joining protein Ku
LRPHIVHTKSGHFDPSQFEDRYENALIDLLKKKQAGEKIEPARETPRQSDGCSSRQHRRGGEEGTRPEYARSAVC